MQTPKQKLIQKLQEFVGEDKDTENFDIPKGENIGEYRFCNQLRLEGENQALAQLRDKIPNLVDELLVINEQDLDDLKNLREICIEEDLLDLSAYDSISKADKIQSAWDALEVIEKILTNNNKE